MQNSSTNTSLTDSSLTGKIALVTGAGRGIGRGIAHQLSRRGVAVALAEIDATAGHEVLAELTALGRRAIFLQTDVRSEELIQAAAAETIRVLGGLNVLVNNAGQNMHFDAAQMSQAEWDDALAMNLRSAWLCSKYAIPQMVAQGGGVIVNIASVHANMTIFGHLPLCCHEIGAAWADAQPGARLGA